ncbi:MAG: PKD domain-containing protein [Bacteroidetes bacterium]|nr:PKD domain-containing protein [Bacteroidota bacterium]
MKKYLLITLLFVPLSLLFFSCEKEEDPPQPDFTASIVSSTDSQITVSFTDLSSNSPDGWYWTFEGGYPSTSTEQNPTVTYSTSGTFDVTLLATNGGGENEMILYDYVNIAQFNNPTWTDIDIEVNYESTTIPVDGYVLYGQINNTSMSYYAETSGETSTGDQIGLEIYWDNTVDLSEYSTWNLVINYDYVFFNVTNYGSADLTPFYVNYGTADQSIDNIVIDNDSYTKKTGYYYANSGMIILTYLQSDQSSISWTEGNNFYLPWENNQGVFLSNSWKSSELQTVVKEITVKDGGILPATGAR